MLTIGHRGMKAEYPENTITGVREAARAVDVVEIDVRPCGSGELVAAHDDELDRVTGGEGRVSETDVESLRTKQIQGTSATIPTFGELLESWPRKTGVNVDIKGATPVETVIARLSESEIDGPIILSADSAALDTFDPNAVDAMVGLSFWRDHVENVQHAAGIGCDYVHVYHELCFETDVVARAHEAGLAVDAWSIDDGETTERLAAAGVDAITVNTHDAIP